jgi:hypothetical protein
MAELPRYKRPSSLIASGDVQAANISALVQAQQMQTQALTKGIDTIVQFALAKSERDQKMDKLQAMQGEASIMPAVTNEINLLAAEIETNPKFTPEDFAARQKQILAFVKPVYEKDGATGVAMYNKIQTSLQAVSTKYTEREVNRATAESIKTFKNYSKETVVNIGTGFRTNITDQDYLDSIAKIKSDFLDDVVITHPNMLEKFEEEFDLEFASMITGSYVDFVLEEGYAKNDLDAYSKIEDEDFGDRTKTFKSLPFELQTKIKEEAYKKYIERSKQRLDFEAQEDKERDEDFTRTLGFYHLEKDPEQKKKYFMAMIPMADDKAEMDALISIDKEVEVEEQIDFEFKLGVDINDPNIDITFGQLRDYARLNLIRDEKLEYYRQKIILSNDKNRKDAVAKIKLLTGFIEGSIIGLDKSDVIRLNHFEAMEIFNRLEDKHYDEERKRLKELGYEDIEIFSYSKSPNYDELYKETVKEYESPENQKDMDKKNKERTKSYDIPPDDS